MQNFQTENITKILGYKTHPELWKKCFSSLFQSTEFTDIKLTETEIVRNSITVFSTKTSAQESDIVTHKQKLKMSH